MGVTAREGGGKKKRKRKEEGRRRSKGGGLFRFEWWVGVGYPGIPSFRGVLVHCAPPKFISCATAHQQPPSSLTAVLMRVAWESAFGIVCLNSSSPDVIGYVITTTLCFVLFVYLI